MGLFGGTKNNNQIGIDIGTSSIKVVELKLAGNKAELVNHAIIDFNQAEEVSVRNWAPEQTAEMIKKVMAKAKMKSKKCGVSVGVDESFTTYLQMPMIEQKDLNQAVSYEVKKFIPMDITDVKLGSEVIKRDPQTQKIHVLVVAVPNNVIAKYRRVAQLAGLELITLEVETFSLIRTFLKNVNGTVLLLDIGALKTNLSIVKNEHALLNSSLDFGGSHFTKALSHGLNVSENRAEAMKVKEGMSGQAQEVIKSQADRFTAQVQQSVTKFQNEHGEKVSQLLLLGSTSQMKGFQDHLVQALGGIQLLPVNPFQNVTPPSKLPQNILMGLGMRISTAMGIALKPED